ncbi:MAG: hypothetical protein B6244_09550 [Candidatus Cloacimonetes bacterium 4572_55]|nr:MAG: hypothetical protein B6244_09550 [Candidatus Cloacimonetes bacterium 4572_55]
MKVSIRTLLLYRFIVEITNKNIEINRFIHICEAMIMDHRSEITLSYSQHDIKNSKKKGKPLRLPFFDTR